ncbi:MAG: outer membrane protein assembly factor BamE [Pseudomonadota bacterium]
MRISRRVFLTSSLIGGGLVLSGCASRTRHHGYIVSQQALSQVPIGSSQEQVLLALGTPSTTSTIGGESFYYISSKIEERAFFAPEVTERRVLAVNFDGEQRVERITEYGLRDGRVFDFTNRTTPTGGRDVNFISQILDSGDQDSPQTVQRNRRF